MTTIVIMHSVIIDAEQDEDDVGGCNYDQDSGKVLREEEYQWHNPLVLLEFLKIHKEIEDKQACERLQKHLLEIQATSRIIVVVAKPGRATSPS